MKIEACRYPKALTPVPNACLCYSCNSCIPARPTTSGASYGYRGSLVATGVAVALCFTAILVAVIRRVAVTSSSNSISKTLGKSSSPPQTPQSKSTASLAGGDDQEIQEIADGGSIGGRSADALAGFDTNTTTCAVINRSGVTSDEEIAEYTSLQKKKSPGCSDATQSITADLIGETTLSEHQLMLPRGKSFCVHRQSPEGRTVDRYSEASPIQEFATFSQWVDDGWMGAVSGGQVGPQYRAAMDTPRKYR